MNVECPVLRGGSFIPTKYANRGVPGGQNTSLPVAWYNPPPQAASFLLTIVDRHPIARNWAHWIVADIPSQSGSIAEDASCHPDRLPPGSVELRNSFGTMGYGGPQPPRRSGPHRYEITIYSLSVSRLDIQPTAALDEVLHAIQGKVLESASVVGVFEQ